MVDELTRSLETYMQDWQEFVGQRKNQEFFAGLKPISTGWKVADTVEYAQVLAELQPLALRVSGSWLDERWLGGLYLKEALPSNGIRHLKLMQRRPAKPNDQLGLDHVDFLLPDNSNIEQLLHAEPGVTWEREYGDLCEWISIRFIGGEAKLRFPDKTSFDAVIQEWQQVKREITGV